jgi:aerobic-type carbon monoxide dehydrogenase small subunit (CoxS/CutS family)
MRTNHGTVLSNNGHLEKTKTNCDNIKESEKLISVGAERVYSHPYHISFEKHVKVTCLEFLAEKAHYFLIFYILSYCSYNFSQP